MIVITKNTEDVLLKEVNRCYQDGIAQRCIYLRFSQLDEMQDIWFTPLSNALEGMESADIPQLYLCHDGDVFILMRDITQKRTDQLIGALKPDIQHDDLNDLCGIFEVKVHWKNLQALCTKKLEALNRMKEEKEKAKEEAKKKERQEKNLAQIDPYLVGSLPARREQRTEPLVMIAEDDTLIRMMVKNVLEKDFALSIVEDGPGAISGYAECAPDILFLDIGLPGLSGHDALERIMQIDPDAYVIMFSGRKDKANVLKALERGAQGFVGKPFTREKLFQYIEQSPYIQGRTNGRKTAEG